MALKRGKYDFPDSQILLDSGSDTPATMSNVVVHGGDLTEVTPLAEMQRILECPICRDVPLPPIFNCSSGHIICGDCLPKVPLCGICRLEYTGSRNFTLEDIVSTSKMACKFREHGCNMSLTGVNLKKHLEDCKFRPMKCIFGTENGCNCPDIGPESYTRHLKEVHKLNSIPSENGSYIFQYKLEDSAQTDFRWNLKTYARYQGKTFLPRAFLENNMFHFALAMVGSELDASKYTVRLLLRPPGDAKNRMEYVVPVVSVRKSTDEITEQVHCLLTKVILKNSISKSEALADGKEALLWEIKCILSE